VCGVIVLATVDFNRNNEIQEPAVGKVTFTRFQIEISCDLKYKNSCQEVITCNTEGYAFFFVSVQMKRRVFKSKVITRLCDFVEGNRRKKVTNSVVS
jgi:hypothetical protein